MDRVTASIVRADIGSNTIFIHNSREVKDENTFNFALQREHNSLPSIPNG